MQLNIYNYLFGLLGLFVMMFSFEPPSFGVVLEEQCDNGIDDDEDGLIDLNDPDCNCPVFEPVSMIPNPSFEEMNCCPSWRSELHCAKTWIQASDATTDYLHTCGWMGWDDLPVPLPIPDGEACVGYRNGRFNEDEQHPNWKEYAGACLLAPLKANVEYKFQFFIGFTSSQYSPPTEIVFYGTPDCSFLPFGSGDETHGCPTNGAGWQRLGSVQALGASTWLLKEITIIPPRDINAIAIGPNCRELSRTANTYYFFDNLVLAEQKAFEFSISSNGESICGDQFGMRMPVTDEWDYQWYKDGVALVGEIGNTLSSKYGEGQYQVMMIGATGCKVTRGFNYIIPEFSSALTVQICEGETFDFYGQSIKEEGIYQYTLQNTDGCDSTIYLQLDVAPVGASTVYAKIFEQETYKIGDYSFDQPGTFQAELQTNLGCDSIVQLNLDYYEVFIPNVFSPNDDGVNDTFTIYGSNELKGVNSLQVFDRWGDIVYSANSLTPNDELQGWDGNFRGKLASPGVYIYIAKVIMDDEMERLLSGSVLLMR